MLVALAVWLELFNLRLAGAVYQLLLPLHGTDQIKFRFIHCGFPQLLGLVSWGCLPAIAATALLGTDQIKVRFIFKNLCWNFDNIFLRSGHSKSFLYCLVLKVTVMNFHAGFLSLSVSVVIRALTMYDAAQGSNVQCSAVQWSVVRCTTVQRSDVQ